MSKLRFAFALLALSFAAGTSTASADDGPNCPGAIAASDELCQFTGKLCNSGKGCKYECWEIEGGNVVSGPYENCITSTTEG